MTTLPSLLHALALPLHFGGLHPYETALALFLAFGPFVVLGVVIALRRRHDAAEEAAEEAADVAQDSAAAVAEPADRSAPPS